MIFANILSRGLMKMCQQDWNDNQFLKEMIVQDFQKLKTENKKKSYRWLENQYGTSRSTFQRFGTGQTSLEDADISWLLPIMSEIYGTEEAKKIILANDLLKEKFANYIAYPKEDLNKLKIMFDIDSIIQDRETCITFLLSINTNGSSLEQIQSALGDAGLVAARKLSKAGKILIQDDGRIVEHPALQNDEDKVYSFTRESIKVMAPYLLSFYRPQNAGKKKNFLSVSTESLNQKGKDELHALFTETSSKVGGIVSDPENHGVMPYFAILALDSFVDSEDRE
jgi:predicted transcriptional regulator